MPVLALTDQTFESEVLRSEVPVLLCLTAGFDEGSQQTLPILDEIALETAGAIKVMNADLEQCPMVAQSLRIQAVPTFLVIDKGQMVGQEAGVLSKEALLKMLEPVLPKSAAAVAPKELSQLLLAGRAQPVDIRDERSYGRYRIPGAVNIPADELARRAAELAPTDGRVRVLYGRTQDQTKDACDALAAEGVQAAYLEGGFLFWEADGFEVERG